MKRRNLLILLAALAVVGILVFTLLGPLGGKENNKTTEPGEQTENAAPTPEPTPVDPELPMDDTPLTIDPKASSGEESGEEPPAESDQAESSTDPEETEEDSDIGPEKDELPISP